MLDRGRTSCAAQAHHAAIVTVERMRVYNPSPCTVCRRVGWDRDDCWFAHCCMLNGAERKMFAENSLGIAHCPSANLRLGSGIAKVCLHGPGLQPHVLVSSVPN